MKKHNHFYHHIVVIDSIHIGLDSLDLEPSEKEELVMLVENNIVHSCRQGPFLAKQDM